jgi:hypothetical protein
MLVHHHIINSDYNTGQDQQNLSIHHQTMQKELFIYLGQHMKLEGSGMALVLVHKYSWSYNVIMLGIIQ